MYPDLSFLETPRRKVLRIANCDYSRTGPYFVTICTGGRRCTLGSIDSSGGIHLTAAGRIVQQEWRALTSRFPGLLLDEFVIMPNHLHAVLAFVGAGLAPPGVGTRTSLSAGCNRQPALPDVLCAFKSISTRVVNQDAGTPGKLWQRGYYEHIIRNSEDMKIVQRYILENPGRWALDTENPNCEINPKPEI
jgi:putative transposase